MSIPFPDLCERVQDHIVEELEVQLSKSCDDTRFADSDAGCPRALKADASVADLKAALRECGAPFSTAPGSVAQCQSEISAEFQRRVDVANDALSKGDES